MSVAATAMGNRLTTPFARGGDTLELGLAPAEGGSATVTPYLRVASGGFAEHRARFEVEPDPRYVLACRRDVAVDTAVTLDWEAANGVSGTSEPARFPAGTGAGTSIVVRFPRDTPAGPELKRLCVDPAGPTSRPADDWGLTALLGNLAKLLWAAGAERDQIRRQLEVIAQQRRSASAVGHSLDLLGYDLGVPRFPPLPYGLDPDTLVLLHLDDDRLHPPDKPDAADALAPFKDKAHHHHADNVEDLAVAGGPGRFGTAFAFRAPDAKLSIASHDDFALGPDDSFTVECFVQPDPGAEGAIISKQATPGSAGTAGWALLLGDFERGIETSLRWVVSDGRAANAVSIFADQQLDSTHFHHVAGVTDRSAKEARLYVNGQLRSRLPLKELGSLTNPEPVIIGMHGKGGAATVIDEVRLSRVARERFDPVLGETDASYRRRLAIFERWTLPTPANIETAINDAVDGEVRPFVVDDASATLVTGSKLVQILPRSVPPGGRVDRLGRRGISEQDACGAPEDDELTLDPAWLVSVDDPLIDFDAVSPRAVQAGKPSPDARLMHRAVAVSLGLLQSRLESVGGRLQVRSAFDPGAGDLRAVGRGVLLTHSTLESSSLAPHALGAEFDFVEHRARERAVYAAVKRREHLTIGLSSPSPEPLPPGPTLHPHDVIEVHIEPAVPGDATVEWSIIQSGVGRLRFNGPRDRPVAVLEVVDPGEVTVHVDVTRRASSAAGSRTFRVVPRSLAVGETIAADGRGGVDASVAEGAGPLPVLHPAYLVNFDGEGVEFAPGANGRLMQRGVRSALFRLLEGLPASPSPRLRVLAAYDPAVSGSAARGRRVIVSGNVPSGELAALAHTAGFEFVSCERERVVLCHREEESLAIDTQGVSVITEGSDLRVKMSPAAAPEAVAVTPSAVYTLNPGTETVSEVDPQKRAVTRGFKVGRLPRDMTIDPSGERRLYTADFGAAALSVVDLVGGKTVKPIALGISPSAIVHHPTLERLFVACEGDQSLRAVDVPTGATIASATIGSGTPRLALAADEQRLFAIASNAPEVRILTLDRLQLSARLELPDKPQRIALAKRGRAGWVTLPGTAGVAVIDQGSIAGSGQAPKVTRVVTLHEVPAEHAPPDESEVAAAPSGTEAYVLERQAGATRGFVVDTANVQPVSEFDVDSFARRIAAAPASDELGAHTRIYVPTQTQEVAVLEHTAHGIAHVTSLRLGSGLGEEIRWVARPIGGGKASLRSMTRPVTTLASEYAGAILLTATYSLGDNAPPYTLEVRLREGLDVRETTIRRDQYDLAMNVLNLLHPIGVEVDTKAIRSHVAEIREGLIEAFPDYTYPKFRVPGPAPVGLRKE